MVRYLAVGATLLVLFLPGLVQGQGVLVVTDPAQQVRLPRPSSRPAVPPPQETYRIKAIDVAARLVDQVARVQVSQSFVNNGSRTLEVSFLFPLPYDGAIDQLTLLVDGKEYPAKLLPADEARRVYEEIVRKNQDPALLEWVGHGLFRTSVFPVPPGAERKVTLRYSQLCRQDRGLSDFLFPLSTAKYTSEPIETVNFRVTIESASEIKNVYSPTHKVEVTRGGPKQATVTYRAEKEIPQSDFRLFYGIDPGEVGTSVISYRPEKDEDGYFLLLASPRIKAPDAKREAKTVVFVVDRSGSMSGQKMEQARGALRFVLNQLRPGDLFNIVAYDGVVESFRPELQRFDDETRTAAMVFVEGLVAGGSTNIDEALRVALAQLKEDERPSYVIFLTDGMPTAGEVNEAKIVDNTRSANDVRARVFAFGVGYDVNSRLLDKLVRANFGHSEYVRPDEDIEDRVSRLASKIDSPVLTDVRIDLISRADDQPEEPQAEPIYRTYPQGAIDLFEGEQLVLVGRYRRPGEYTVKIKGQLGGEEQTFEFDAELVERSGDDTYAFAEKLWAVRRVGDIIDEIDLHGKNDELVKELVELATRHGILTPYTSFLADESTDIRATAANQAAAGRQLERLAETSGRGGFEQRAAKSQLQAADQAPVAGAPLQIADDDLQGQLPAIETVRQVGSKTFYRRGGQWVEASVTEEQQQRAIRVEQFSDEYFRLARAGGPASNQYLALDEPVVVELSGQVYLIEPAQGH